MPSAAIAWPALLSASVSWTRLSNFEAFVVFLKNGSNDPMPRFPPRGPAGSRSPASRVLSRHCDFLPPLPPRFVAFAWRYHGRTRDSLPSDRVRSEGPGVVCPVSPPGNCRGDDRISQVLGEPPLSVCTCSSTPAGPLVPDHLRNSSVAPAMETTKAPTMMNAFEALWHGFRTSYLRFVE